MKKRLRKILTGAVSNDEVQHIYNAYDIVGDIAIIRLNENSRKYGKIAAEAIMQIHKNVRTVLGQVGPVCGELRLRKLEHIAGENKTTTTHRESGCVFSIDVAQCYFSPRLSFERLRVANQVKKGENVLNMFAGAGCFSIIIAKNSTAKKIYSVDVNPVAVKFMRENVRLNGVYGRVVPLEGDAKVIIQKRLCGMSDRVLMPLPEKALAYIPFALLALRRNGGWIHYYDFEHANKGEEAVKKVKAKIAEKLDNLGVNFEVPFGRVVRTTGPNWHQIVLDVFVKGQLGQI